MVQAQTQDQPRKAKQIKDTAYSLFTKYGYKRVSVEEICREAGVSKATYYKYYPNKIELVRQVLNDLFEVGFKDSNRVLKSDLPIEEKIKWIVDYKLEMSTKLGSVFIKEIIQSDNEISETMTEARIRSQLHFRKFLRSSQKKGDLNPNLKPEFIVIIIEKMMDLARDGKIQELYENYTDLVRDLNSVFFYGIIGESRAGSGQ